MTVTLTRRTSSGLALAILLVAIIAIMRLISALIWSPFASQLEAVQSRSAQLLELRVAEADRTPLEARVATFEAALRKSGAFWSDLSRAQSEVIIQDVLRSAAQSNSGHVVSSAAIASPEHAELIEVRARIEGTSATLERVLTAVQANRPRLFVDALDITSPSGPSTASRPQTLSFEVAVHGLVVERPHDGH